MGPERLPIDSRHDIRAAEARPGVGVGAVEPAPQRIHRERERLVLAVPQRAKDRLALGPDLVLRQGRREGNVGDQREEVTPAPAERGAPDLAEVRVRRGTDAAADLLRGLREGKRGAARRSLHHDLLQEIADPRGRVRLPARSGSHEERDHDDRRRAVLDDEHGQPVGEDALRRPQPGTGRLGRAWRDRDQRAQERGQRRSSDPRRQPHGAGLLGNSTRRAYPAPR